MLQTNADWNMYLYGDSEEHEFMERYFQNTSILWAFKLANPKIGVTYSDIFRYCALWLFGGVFMDDDASMATPLHKLIGLNDSMILTNEKGYYVDKYAPFFHLSTGQLERKYCGANTTSCGTSPGRMFSGRSISNWMMFAAPRNEVLVRTLENIVAVFRAEYMRRSVIWLRVTDGNYERVFYSTGPALLTASTREYALMHPSSTHMPRMSGDNEFAKYGTVRKHGDSSAKGSHYMHRMRDPKIQLLAEYVSRDVEGFLHGRFVLVQRHDEDPPPPTATNRTKINSWTKGHNGTIAQMEAIKREAFNKYRAKLACNKNPQNPSFSPPTPSTPGIVTSASVPLANARDQSMIAWMQRVPFPAAKFYRIVGHRTVIRYPTICSFFAAYTTARSDDPTFSYNIETMTPTEFEGVLAGGGEGRAAGAEGRSHRRACVREAFGTSSHIRPPATGTSTGTVAGTGTATGIATSSGAGTYPPTAPSVTNETLSPPLIFPPGVFSAEGKDFFHLTPDPVDPAGCHRRGFPDWETFLGMNWTVQKVQLIPFKLLEAVPFRCTYVSVE